MTEDKIIIEIEGVKIDVRDTASVRRAVELMELKLKRERAEHRADNKIFGGLTALSSFLLLVSSLRNHNLRRRYTDLSNKHIALILDYISLMEKTVKKG